MNTSKGLEAKRLFLLHNAIELNQLLREERKQWQKIQHLAHEQAKVSELLISEAQKEDELLTIEEIKHEIMEAGPRSAALPMIDFSITVQARGWQPSVQ